MISTNHGFLRFCCKCNTVRETFFFFFQKIKYFFLVLSQRNPSVLDKRSEELAAACMFCSCRSNPAHKKINVVRGNVRSRLKDCESAQMSPEACFCSAHVVKCLVPWIKNKTMQTKYRKKTPASIQSEYLWPPQPPRTHSQSKRDIFRTSFLVLNFQMLCL